MSKPKLKPCPFCGEVPKYQGARDGLETMIICLSDSCPAILYTDAYTEKEAVERWNKRAKK